jgi:hypothetical protein
VDALARRLRDWSRCLDRLNRFERLAWHAKGGVMIDPDVRDRLQHLEWGDGLTRDQIREQWAGFPLDVYEQLPPDYSFNDTGSVASYLRHVAGHDIIGGEPPAGEPPTAWGPSPTGRTVSTPERHHGVGSGADPGHTGATSQTGESQRGTGYGGPKTPDR